MPDRYRTRLMCAACHEVSPATGFFSLYNNGQRGRYLFLYGLQIATEVTDGHSLDGYAFKGKQTGGTDMTTFPLKFDEAVAEGIATYGSGGGTGTAFQIQTLGSNLQGLVNWTNPWPLGIIPAGWSWGFTTTETSHVYSVSFQWYCGEPLDFRPNLTEDVLDFLS